MKKKKKKRKDPLKNFLYSRGYRGVKLKKIIPPGGRSFHYFVEVKINGVPGHFIVDTGSSTTVVDHGKMEKFGMETPADGPEVIAYGAAPGELDVRFAGWNRIALKKWKGGMFPVIAMDINHIIDELNYSGTELDGILGADVLNAAEAVIDYGRNRLYLRKPSKNKKRP
ncbi:MAG: clan AA aspartic protease [Chlorobi bacterium]|nr:clan AA aspartic protease [Chlorobiota bacterium]